MSSNNIKWVLNLFRSSSNTFKQSSLIFFGDKEILPLSYVQMKYGKYISIGTKPPRLDIYTLMLNTRKMQQVNIHRRQQPVIKILQI